MMSVGRVLVAVLLVGSMPLALPAAPDADRLIESLRACASLSNDGERLSCFDRTVQLLESGEHAAKPAASAEEMFGMGRVARQNTDSTKREELTQVTSKVKSVSRAGDNTPVISLENGQVWQGTEETRSLLLEPGDTVTVSRAALGSFRMATPHGRGLKVRRLR